MIALEELKKIVGADNVISDPQTLQNCSVDISLVKGFKPESVAKPRNAGEVVKIVDLAQSTRTPLVPISSGPPHFHGDSLPEVEGAVIVDLSNLKNIIRVDRLNRVALFEPGVTFGELIPAVAKEGLRLNLPLLPRRSKSVVGSLLEREPVIMPVYHWDISDPLACLEVVFGTGDVYRTGSAAGPGNLEEQWQAGGSQKEAAGPASASLYRLIQGAQGTMGIATWASVRCEIIPALEQPFLVGSLRLEKLLELTHWLMRLRLVKECFILNRSDLASILSVNWLADYRRIKKGLPPWILFYNLAGGEYLPEERVNGQIEDISKITLPLKLESQKVLGEVSASALLAAARQVCAEPYWKLRAKGASHDIFFLALYDRIPELVKTFAVELETAGLSSSQTGIYLQPIVQGVNCHCEFTLFYDAGDKMEVRKLRQFSVQVVKQLMAKGAFFSRPYGENTRQILDKAPDSVEALKKVKSIVDPANILNPGKLVF